MRKLLGPYGKQKTEITVAILDEGSRTIRLL
jgi:hypothetical protein